MAKRRGRKENGQRDVLTPSLDTLLDFPDPAPLPRVSPRTNPLTLEDRRVYHPLRKAAPPASVSLESRKLVVPRVQRKNSPTLAQFNLPRNVSVCVRRKQRREVLFATRRTGRGASKKRRTRNQFSDIRC